MIMIPSEVYVSQMEQLILEIHSFIYQQQHHYLPRLELI